MKDGELRERGEDKTNMANEAMRAESIMGAAWVEDVKASFKTLVLERMQAEKEVSDHHLGTQTAPLIHTGVVR